MKKADIKLQWRQRLALWVGLALVLQALLPALVAEATANVMTFTMVRTDRMAVGSTKTTGTVCAKPTTTGTEASVKVTFPSSSNYTVSTTLTDWAVSTANTTSWPKDPSDGTTSATAWPSIAQPTSGNVSGQSVTFGSGDLTVGTWYCFNWTNQNALTIIGSATASLTGTVITQTSTPTTIDTGNYALATVSNDQIAVTATVNPSFNFSLSSNAAALGTLSTSSPTASSAINATVNTNAQKGWNIWASDPAGTPGLTSSTAAKTIAYSPSAGSTSAALSNGVEGYNLGAGTPTQTSGSGTITDDANFASGGTSFKGGGLDNTPRIVAVSTGTANNAVVPLTVNASISAITPAATDYAGTMTIIAAGRF